MRQSKPGDLTQILLFDPLFFQQSGMGTSSFEQYNFSAVPLNLQFQHQINHPVIDLFRNINLLQTLPGSINLHRQKVFFLSPTPDKSFGVALKRKTIPQQFAPRRWIFDAGDSNT